MWSHRQPPWGVLSTAVAMFANQHCRLCGTTPPVLLYVPFSCTPMLHFAMPLHSTAAPCKQLGSRNIRRSSSQAAAAAKQIHVTLPCADQLEIGLVGADLPSSLLCHPACVLLVGCPPMSDVSVAFPYSYSYISFFIVVCAVDSFHCVLMIQKIHNTA